MLNYCKSKKKNIYIVTKKCKAKQMAQMSTKEKQYRETFFVVVISLSGHF